MIMAGGQNKLRVLQKFDYEGLVMKLLRYSAVAAILALGPISYGTTFAATCPTDLTSLQGQVQTDEIKQKLGDNIDQTIASAGGLDAAIANAQQMQQNLSNGNGFTGHAADLVADLKLVVPVFLQALQCRKSQ
jgi:hypothetical protein